MRVVCLLVLVLPLAAQQGWWMREPLRWVQTNLRETDATLDPQRLVEQLADFRANVLLLNMGGIAAHYPTAVEFHRRSPQLPAGRDTFGEVLRLAHARGIRVVGRFDFSKTDRSVYDARPEWFFRQASGEPVVYNSLHSTCINGGYYRVQVMKILAEALERYEVDGLFFNMFGNSATDYSGRSVGLCHCSECRRRFRERYGRPLPDQPDDQYREFMFASSREVAGEIGKLIRARRPQAGFFNYMHEHVDGIMSESNTAVNRPLPLWPYASSDNVNVARNSEPGKMAVNLNMSFVDFPWRFATVPPAEIALRIWQNVAHGGAATLNMHGTMDQQDRQALEAARPVFHWLAANESHYAGQQSDARVLLLGRGRAPQASYRGVFRILTESHVSFAVSDNLDWLGRRGQFDLIVATGWLPRELEAYVREGGRLLVAGPTPPPLDLGPVVRRWESTTSCYFRVRDRGLFPSLRSTELVWLNGPYAELEPPARPLLTLVSPSMFGPPEKVHIDQTETDKPGLILRDYGKGRLAWLPWDLGRLYYYHSSPVHAGVLADLMDHLLPRGRQVRTNAHPLVEITVMRQQGRRLVHLVNVSGHSSTGYFAPLPMSDLRVTVTGSFGRARALRAGVTLDVRPVDGASEFTLPRLADYELVVVE